MSVIVTTGINPAVTNAKSDLNKSGLMRSGATTPASVVTPALLLWRRSTAYPTNPSWR